MDQSTSSAPDGPSARGRNAMPYLSFQWGMCRLPGLWMGSQAVHRSAAADSCIGCRVGRRSSKRAPNVVVKSWNWWLTIVCVIRIYEYAMLLTRTPECKCSTSRAPINPSLSCPCDESPPGPICYGIAR
jgi:hypothetical protein